MDKITHEVRLSQWTSIIEECARSGLPKTKWCTENDGEELMNVNKLRNKLSHEYGVIELTPDYILVIKKVDIDRLK